MNGELFDPGYKSFTAKQQMGEAFWIDNLHHNILMKVFDFRKKG